MDTKFDEIADSIRNGQRTQAYNQMCELDGDDLYDMLDYFAIDLCDSGLAIGAAKTYFRNMP